MFFSLFLIEETSTRKKSVRRLKKKKNKIAVKKEEKSTEKTTEEIKVKGGFILIGPHHNYPIHYMRHHDIDYWYNNRLPHLHPPMGMLPHPAITQHPAIHLTPSKIESKTDVPEKAKKSRGIFNKETLKSFAFFWYDFFKSQFFVFLPNMIYSVLNWLFNPPNVPN